MTSETSAAPERWTYDGTMDDVVERHPWPGIPLPSRNFLDAQLVCSAVTGTPILLNDGYLVFNSACFESIHDRYSPLRVLIRKKYLRVLVRKESLEGGVLTGAEQKMKNREDILKDPKRWSDTQRVLSEVEIELREHDGLVGWPHVDVSLTYQELIRFLVKLHPDVLSRDGVPYQTFRKVADRFDDEMSKEPRNARTKWERIVGEVVTEVGGTVDDIKKLMQLGNEVYHHNFGAALSARPPDTMAENVEIAVQTRISEALSPFSKTHTLQAGSGSIVPEVFLPWKVDYARTGLLDECFNESSPVGRCRAEYLKLRANYRVGSLSTEDMAEKRDEYQQKINEYLRPWIPTPITELLIAGLVRDSVRRLDHRFAGSEKGFLIAVFAFFLEYAGLINLSRIVERYGVREPERTVRLKLQDLYSALSGRQVLTSLAVDPAEARRLVGSLPVL